MTVYLIECLHTGNIKIGYTKNDPQSRLKQLKTAASTPIHLLRIFEGLSMKHEQELHRIYQKYHVTNEWFTSEVLDTIDENIEIIKLRLQEKVIQDSTQEQFKGISKLADWVLTPRYSKINSYIDRLWKQESDKNSMSVEEYFNYYLKLKGHVILQVAYDINNYSTYQDLQDLVDYTDKIVKSLENPVVPFSIHRIKDLQHPKRIEWEKRKKTLKTLSESIKECLEVYKLQVSIKILDL